MSIYKQQKEQIRTAIIDQAISLFKEKGYDKVSIDEITKSVGIAKGTFYNFYTSKKDILMVWSIQNFQQMQMAVNNLADSKKTIEENLNSLIEMLCQLIKQEQTLFFNFLRELIQSNKEAKSNSEFDFASLLFQIISNSKDSITIGPHYIDCKIRVINGSLFYEILEWFYNGKPIEDLEEHLKCIVKVCLYGIYKNMEESLC